MNTAGLTGAETLFVDPGQSENDAEKKWHFSSRPAAQPKQITLQAEANAKEGGAAVGRAPLLSCLDRAAPPDRSAADKEMPPRVRRRSLRSGNPNQEGLMMASWAGPEESSALPAESS
jgi:hypothetical protein